MNFENYLEELKKIDRQDKLAEFYKENSATLQFFKAIDGTIRDLLSAHPSKYLIIIKKSWDDSLEKHLEGKILDELKRLKNQIDKISSYEKDNSMILLSYKSKIGPIIHYIKNEMPVNAVNNTAKQLYVLTGECGEALVKQGEGFFKNKQYEEALTCFKQALGIHVGIKERRIERLEQKITQTRKLADLNSQIMTLNSEAQKAIANKNYKKAIDIYDEIIKLDHNNSTAKEEKKKLIGKQTLVDAQRLFDDKKYNEAVDCYDAVLKLDPNNIEALKWKADILQNHLDRQKEALICCNKILELDLNNIEILKEKANILDSIGKCEEAIICYDKILKLDSNNISFLLRKRKTLIKLKREEEANDCLNKILEIDTNDLWHLMQIGRALESLKRYDEAINCCDKILELKPDIDSLIRKAELLCSAVEDQDSFNILYIIVNQNVKLSDKFINYLDQAVCCYDKVLKLEPNNYKALDGKIRILMLMVSEKYEEVIICCDKILGLGHYDKLDAYILLIIKAFALGKLTRYQEAIACCNEVLKSPKAKQYEELAKAEKKRLKKLKGGWWPW